MQNMANVATAEQLISDMRAHGLTPEIVKALIEFDPAKQKELVNALSAKDSEEKTGFQLIFESGPEVFINLTRRFNLSDPNIAKLLLANLATKINGMPIFQVIAEKNPQYLKELIGCLPLTDLETQQALVKALRATNNNNQNGFQVIVANSQSRIVLQSLVEKISLNIPIIMDILAALLVTEQARMILFMVIAYSDNPSPRDLIEHLPVLTGIAAENFVKALNAKQPDGNTVLQVINEEFLQMLQDLISTSCKDPNVYLATRSFFWGLVKYGEKLIPNSTVEKILERILYIRVSSSGKSYLQIIAETEPDNLIDLIVKFKFKLSDPRIVKLVLEYLATTNADGTPIFQVIAKSNLPKLLVLIDHLPLTDLETQQAFAKALGATNWYKQDGFQVIAEQDPKILIGLTDKLSVSNPDIAKSLLIRLITKISDGTPKFQVLTQNDLQKLWVLISRLLFADFEAQKALLKDLSAANEKTRAGFQLIANLNLQFLLDLILKLELSNPSIAKPVLDYLATKVPDGTPMFQVIAKSDFQKLLDLIERLPLLDFETQKALVIAIINPCMKSGETKVEQSIVCNLKTILNNLIEKARNNLAITKTFLKVLASNSYASLIFDEIATRYPIELIRLIDNLPLPNPDIEQALADTLNAKSNFYRTGLESLFYRKSYDILSILLKKTYNSIIIQKVCSEVVKKDFESLYLIAERCPQMLVGVIHHLPQFYGKDEELLVKVLGANRRDYPSVFYIIFKEHSQTALSDLLNKLSSDGLVQLLQKNIKYLFYPDSLQSWSYIIKKYPNINIFQKLNEGLHQGTASNQQSPPISIGAILLSQVKNWSVQDINTLEFANIVHLLNKQDTENIVTAILTEHPSYDLARFCNYMMEQDIEKLLFLIDINIVKRSLLPDISNERIRAYLEAAEKRIEKRQQLLVGRSTLFATDEGAHTIRPSSPPGEELKVLNLRSSSSSSQSAPASTTVGSVPSSSSSSPTAQNSVSTIPASTSSSTTQSQQRSTVTPASRAIFSQEPSVSQPSILPSPRYAET
ncbi:MAG: hypothetical protein WCW01_06320, partial [Gammaproteobacteria bacterium]